MINSLTAYLSVRGQMKPGDGILFHGKGGVSPLIEEETQSPISHCALVRNAFSHSEGKDVTIIESTILDGRNGVQTNELGVRLSDYPGDASWVSLSAKSRALFDLQAFYAACGEMDGHIKYDVGGLFKFPAREIPVLGARFWQDENRDMMVCSAAAVHLLEASRVLRGFNDSKMTPQLIAEMAIWDKLVTIVGKPMRIKRFNSM